MSQKSILFTQCLQNDFVKPIDKFEPIPNLLHVGVDESKRLMGEIPEEGPVALTMDWAYRQSSDELSIIHIRDWHDATDPHQHDHLRQFGEHCLADTEGSKFAFPASNIERKVHIVNSPGLSDFLDTNLNEILEPLKDLSLRVGIVGVWTEAKVSYLAYDLRTRFPNLDIGVCSALTASSSRSQHYIALDQLQKLLGVKIFSSIGEFTEFLGGSSLEFSLPQPSHKDKPKIILENDSKLNEVDENIIRYLFRDCNEVKLNPLAGGYSGNLVLGCESKDIHGHTQVPHVVKIGPEGPMGQERTAFEQIEEVLGNNAPSITGFADYGGRGSIKYRYAAMGGAFSNTFQKLYMKGLSEEKTKFFLATVFKEQLGRLYNAATSEYGNLMEYYWFDPERASGVRKNVEAILGKPADSDKLTLPNGLEFPNPCIFYEKELEKVLPLATRSSYFSYIHGDLNGANIIVDAHDNVWIIDFFHTHRGHVLKDLIKFENDLLYIFTQVNSYDDLTEAINLTNFLFKVEDLRKPLPDVEETDITHKEMVKAYKTIKILRSFYPDLIKHDRDPTQLLIGLLRYSAHTLIFEESNQYQKEWALYNTGVLSHLITKRLKHRGPLRVDWIDDKYTHSGKMGITLLPGRKDYGRDLNEDIIELKKKGIDTIVALLTDIERDSHGIPELFDAYKSAGLNLKRMPILDQGVSSTEAMEELTGWIEKELKDGHNILIHCVGGLGRAGLVAASYLKIQGLESNKAIDEVRRVRSQRALESTAQEDFVNNFLN
jgi:protein-tyrosine phosphatase/nicotinamidase-related amidase